MGTLQYKGTFFFGGKRSMFQYEIARDGETVEQLLRNEWRLGKKQVHELRMAKAITKDGEPVVLERRAT